MDNNNNFSLTTTGLGNSGSTSNMYINTNFGYPSNNFGNCGTTLTVTNNSMRQVKVAVFAVERGECNEVIDSHLIEELWVNQKPGVSLELLVVKALKGGDFDPETTVIREIYSVTL